MQTIKQKPGEYTHPCMHVHTCRVKHIHATHTHTQTCPHTQHTADAPAGHTSSVAVRAAPSPTHPHTAAGPPPPAARAASAGDPDARGRRASAVGQASPDARSVGAADDGREPQLLRGKGGRWMPGENVRNKGWMGTSPDHWLIGPRHFAPTAQGPWVGSDGLGGGGHLCAKRGSC